MTVKVVWHIVKESAKSIGVAKLEPHDLRRTCARPCHTSGGELEQIQFILGTFRFRQPNDTVAASSGFNQQSMIVLASSRILNLGAAVPEEWPTIQGYYVEARIEMPSTATSGG